jgi:hypothetical protein
LAAAQQAQAAAANLEAESAGFWPTQLKRLYRRLHPHT